MGLDKVFKEILLPRFERLEGIAKRPLIQEIPLTNGNKHKDWKIEGFDKRIDHRHHALDALVVALTRQGYIQRLSNVNQMEATAEEKEAMKRPTWYPLPHPDLRDMVRMQLERTIPSIKNRQRLLTKTTNKTAYYDKEKQQVIPRDKGRLQSKGDLRAVRGPLHNEQPLGEIKEQHKWDVLKFIKQLKGEPDPICLVASEYPREERLLAHEWQRQKVHEHLVKYDGNVDAILKAWKKDPIKGQNGETLKEVTVIERKYSKTRSLNPTFTVSQLGLVIDRGLRRDLEQHILRSMPERSEKERLAAQLASALYEKPELIKKEEKQLAKFLDKGIEKAFTAEGLQVLNRGRRVPLRQVKCKMDDALVDQALSRERLLKRGDPNRKRFVEKFEKHALVVHVDMTTGKREPEPVSLYDAVERTMQGLPLAEEQSNCKQFVLKRNSLVYVPRPGEEERDVDWNELDYVGQRLYRAVKFSTQNYFLPVTISSVVKLESAAPSEQEEEGEETKAPREYGTQDCTEWVDSDEPRTKIIERFIPVELDRLGRKVKPLDR
jgi:CRISPR-associated endonuclease Csn1